MEDNIGLVNGVSEASKGLAPPPSSAQRAPTLRRSPLLPLLFTRDLLRRKNLANLLHSICIQTNNRLH